MSVILNVSDLMAGVGLYSYGRFVDSKSNKGSLEDAGKAVVYSMLGRWVANAVDYTNTGMIIPEESLYAGLSCNFYTVLAGDMNLSRNVEMFFKYALSDWAGDEITRRMNLEKNLL